MKIYRTFVITKKYNVTKGRMEQDSKTLSKKVILYVILTVLAVFLVTSTVALWTCNRAFKAENHVRYVGAMSLAAEKLAKTVSGMEMNAKNVFDEVEKHIDSPEEVITALECKTSLNPEIRGYFAAFEPNYYPEKGQWYEPYVHHIDSNEFEVRMVGSARHNYHKSNWYVRAKKSNESFWSDPYYYYDGTSISGHYSTFVKPVFDAKGRLACVCGADMTFEWLSKELLRIDRVIKESDMIYADADFYTVVVNSDGSCIAHPEGKVVSLTDESVRRNLEQEKSGVVDMEINGVPSTVYYGPIDHVDWSVAVVVENQHAQDPLIKAGAILLLVSVIGLIIVWFVCRRLRYAETV